MSVFFHRVPAMVLRLFLIAIFPSVLISTDVWRANRQRYFSNPYSRGVRGYAIYVHGMMNMNPAMMNIPRVFFFFFFFFFFSFFALVEIMKQGKRVATWNLSILSRSCLSVRAAGILLVRASSLLGYMEYVWTWNLIARITSNGIGELEFS